MTLLFRSASVLLQPVPPFRRSASFVRFLVAGGRLDPDDDGFFAALAEHRFRGIENAASEETSVGWVSPADPSGTELAREHIVFDELVWLRMRIDRKRLPPAWRTIWLAAEIRARGGRPPGARERQAILADVERKVLPRVLPSVRLVDVVVDPAEATVLLFSTANAVEVECARLFRATFGVNLERAGPGALAMRCGFGDAPGDLAPLVLGPPERAPVAPAHAAAERSAEEVSR